MERASLNSLLVGLSVSTRCRLNFCLGKLKLKSRMSKTKKPSHTGEKRGGR